MEEDSSQQPDQTLDTPPSDPPPQEPPPQESPPAEEEAVRESTREGSGVSLTPPNESYRPRKRPLSVRPSDQEQHEKQQAELEAERQEHNERTGDPSVN